MSERVIRTLDWRLELLEQRCDENKTLNVFFSL